MTMLEGKMFYFLHQKATFAKKDPPRIDMHTLIESQSILKCLQLF